MSPFEFARGYLRLVGTQTGDDRRHPLLGLSALGGPSTSRQRGLGVVELALFAAHLGGGGRHLLGVRRELGVDRLAIVGVVAAEGAHAALAQFQGVAGAIEQFQIVAHHEHAAAELVERPVQAGTRVGVEVVGGFVE